MSGPFQPGDVVVCINADNCTVYPGASAYVRGQIYRVIAAQIFTDGKTGLTDDAIRTDRHNPMRDGVMGWARAIRFSKIDDEVTDEFREQFKSITAPKQATLLNPARHSRELVK